jgi:hypothetical protein
MRLYYAPGACLYHRRDPQATPRLMQFRALRSLFRVRAALLSG